jgi:hypothetical protein
VAEFRVEMGDVPLDALRCGPSVGDVYKKDGGPAGFMLIVSDNGSTHGYLAIALDGRITGVGQGNSYYFSRRCFVGRVDDFPPLQMNWER